MRRLLVVGVLALLPLQLVALYGFGAEPYPALTQPGFSGRAPLEHGVVLSAMLTITVTFDDGTSADLTTAQLLPATGGVDESTILITTFVDQRLALRDDTVAWLRQRTAELYPDRVVTQIDFARSVYSAPVDSLDDLEVVTELWRTSVPLRVT